MRSETAVYDPERDEYVDYWTRCSQCERPFVPAREFGLCERCSRIAQAHGALMAEADSQEREGMRRDTR